MHITPRFLGLPHHLPGDRPAKAVLFGAGHGTTYPGQDSSGHALAADAIRRASQEDAGLVDRWDFDLGGPLFNGNPVCCIDAGNVPSSIDDAAGNRARIEHMIREVLKRPAVPVLIGGDDSIPIPFLAGFADHGPLWVMQIDAHLDWRIEVGGEPYGYSSPMRRISEMPHVAGMVQVGLRAVGSAGNEEVAAARQFGSRFVTAREIHERGPHAALQHIPEGTRCVVTLDCDGLDPSIMPGVAARTPGGLSYTHVIDLIQGLGRRARIAGFDLVEYYPPADIDNMTALTASRIVVNALGTIVRQT
ncbi:agmatinase [Roseibium sp.]|uniref:agmatinase n=1 Tax=Roseibium sp. TaxID=1936156 RepID=UPI003BB001BE